MPGHDGMASREEWAKSPVHQASTYACSKCGQRFATPHDVYDHLDREHPQTAPRNRRKGASK